MRSLLWGAIIVSARYAYGSLRPPGGMLASLQCSHCARPQVGQAEAAGILVEVLRRGQVPVMLDQARHQLARTGRILVPLAGFRLWETGRKLESATKQCRLADTLPVRMLAHGPRNCAVARPRG